MYNNVFDWDSWQFASFPTKRLMLMSDLERFNAFLKGQRFPRKQFSRYFNGMAGNLIHIDWNIIGGLSFEDDQYTFKTNYSQALRERAFLSLVRLACIRLGLHLGREVLFYCKTEYGESGRGHLHALVSVCNKKGISPNIFASTMNDIWTKGMLFKGENVFWGKKFCKGTAKIEQLLSDKLVKAILYTTKYEYDDFNRPLPNHEFKSDKLTLLIQRHNEGNIEKRNWLVCN